MVGHVLSFNQRDELRPQIGYAFFHCQLHLSERAWDQETTIVDGRTVLKKLLQTVDFADKLHQLSNARVFEMPFFTLLPKETKLKVFEVRLCHVDLCLVKEFVILYLNGSGRGIVGFHR